MNKYRIKPILRDEVSGLFPPIQISGKVLFQKPDFVTAIRYEESIDTYFVDLLVKYLRLVDVPQDYAEYKDRDELLDTNLPTLIITGEEDYPPVPPTEMELYHIEVSKALKQIAKIVKNKCPNLTNGQVNKLQNIIDYFGSN